MRGLHVGVRGVVGTQEEGREEHDRGSRTENHVSVNEGEGCGLDHELAVDHAEAKANSAGDVQVGTNGLDSVEKNRRSGTQVLAESRNMKLLAPRKDGGDDGGSKAAADVT